MNRSQDLAETLLVSGAQALEHAAGLVEAQPELAVITFAVGVELTLKARLAFEHWHFVLLDENVKGKPTECWDRLREGRARTVGADRARMLLLRILPSAETHALEQGAEALSALAELRNKAAHFGITASDPGDAASLAAVQLRAWHALHEFTQTWPERLRQLAEAMWEHAESALRQLGAFLQTRADELLPRLKELQQAGGAVGPCMDCHHIGLARAEGTGIAFGQAHCRICRAADLAALGPCPRCEKILLAPLIHDKLELRCATCGLVGRSADLGPVHVIGPPDLRDDPHAPQSPLCGYCATGERTTPVEVAGEIWFICSSCKQYWTSGWPKVSTCDNCGDDWIGLDLEHSSFFGCPLCESSIREHIMRM